MWLDMELPEAKALVEAAEAGQKTGKLRRSPKNLEAALTKFQAWITGEEENLARYKANVERRAAGQVTPVSPPESPA